MRSAPASNDCQIARVETTSWQARPFYENWAWPTTTVVLTEILRTTQPERHTENEPAAVE